jgi:hypothetical protein
MLASPRIIEQEQSRGIVQQESSDFIQFIHYTNIYGVPTEGMALCQALHYSFTLSLGALANKTMQPLIEH